MNEQPEPEPQKKHTDAVPKSESVYRSTDPALADAYVPLPRTGRKRKSGLLGLAALIAAGALAGTAVYFRAPSGPAPIVIAAAEQEKVIIVTDADINVAATEKIRSAPPVNPDQTPAPASKIEDSVAPAAVAPPAQAPGAMIENRPSSPLPIAPPELVSPAVSAPQSVITAQGAKAVHSDGYSIFSMRLIDDVAEDGDVVQILIDGVPMSFLSLSHAGASLDIPLKKGESHRITVKAVRDGTGGITLGLQTSAGTFLSRNMAVGESDTWTVDYK